MNWIETKEQLPPKDARVLVYGPGMGITVAMYQYYPAWEPFNEKTWEDSITNTSDEGKENIVRARDSMRMINAMHRGEPEKHSWACACEDSYWDIDYFTHWAELPKEPI